MIFTINIEYSYNLVIIMLSFGGGGLLNSLIDKLPFELHLPGYRYCGPGTKLKERLARNDQGVNKLDEACKEHDIAYSKSKDLSDRHLADKILGDKAWERVKSGDANFKEKSAALLVTGAMKMKRKMGMGYRKRQKTFKSSVLKPTHKVLMKSGVNDLKKSSLIAFKTARTAIKKAGGKKNIKIPRIIPFESKSGGILPLVPIFAGLSALGTILGGASSVAKTIIDANNAKKKLEEDHRHNKTMESIGHGLFIRKYKRGLGLYIRKQSKN